MNDLYIPPLHLNIERRDMPQIETRYLPELFKWIKSTGVKIHSEKVVIGKLNPSQKTVNHRAIKKLMIEKPKKLHKPLIISKDNYLLDGHHRAFAILNLNKEERVDALRIDLNALDALELLRQFDKTVYKNKNNKVFKNMREALT